MGLSEDMLKAHLDEPCVKCQAKSGDRCVTPSWQDHDEDPRRPHPQRQHPIYGAAEFGVLTTRPMPTTERRRMTNQAMETGVVLAVCPQPIGM